jgi:hypothetical protein
MQRKDYHVLADAFKDVLEQSATIALDRAQFDWIVDAFIARLKADNPAFSADHFRFAIDEN